MNEIECNPNAPDSQAELCIEKEILVTPTWSIEKDGEEQRKEGYMKLEDLAAFSGCALPT